MNLALFLHGIRGHLNTPHAVIRWKNEMHNAPKAPNRSIRRFLRPYLSWRTSFFATRFRGGEYKTIPLSTIARFCHCQPIVSGGCIKTFFSTPFEDFVNLSNSHRDEESDGAQKQYQSWGKNDPPRHWRAVLDQTESERI